MKILWGFREGGKTMDKIKKYLPLAAAVAGALALILFIACPAIVYKTPYGTQEWNGMDVTVGDDKSYKFSFMIFVAVVLAIAGVACAVLSYLKPENKMFALIAAACFAVAAILFFCTVAFAQLDGVSKEYAKEIKKELDLGVGAIFAAILSIVGAGASAAPVVLNK